MSLTELTNKLSKNFDECLETILIVPEPNKEETNEDKNKVIEEQTAILRSTFLQLESQFKKLRVDALQDKELAMKETNRLLKRDIEIKRNAIAKYMDKVEQWDKDIPALVEQSNRATEGRLNGNDFDSNMTSPPPQETTHTQEDDEDDDDDIEFEEV